MQRWAEVIANSRQHSRATEALLAQLDRRTERDGGSRSAPAAQTLRQLLGRITAGIEAGLVHIMQSSAEISDNTREIANGAEEVHTTHS